MALQHLRSSTADKRPTPGAMSDGQLALNTNLVSPGLFFKDSNGDSVKIGPIHVGATAPNATPGAGGQAGNSKGEAWLDTSATNPILKVFNGSAFVAVQPVGTGTVVSTTDTGTVTSTMILDGTIVNADINASAAIADTKLATISTAGKVSNSATTATNANTASAIVARDASGNFSAGTITADLAGNASTVTTNANLTGDVTSVGNATSIAAGVIVNADVNASAAIAGTKISPDFGSQNVVTTGTSTAASLIPTSSSVPTNGVYLPAANTVGVASNSTERLRVDLSGRLLVGTSSARDINSGNDPLFQVERATGSAYISSFTKHSADAFGPHVVFIKTRGTAVGSSTIVASGDEIGSIDFMGTDGTNPEIGASIAAHVDGTPGANDMPGRLTFSTTADGAASPTEAMRINNAGELLVGYTSDNGAYKLQVNSQIFATSATIATSDGRFKENVATLDGCVDLVKALRPVSFDWKPQQDITRTDDDGNEVLVREGHNFPDGTQVGFIAQEVQEVLAEKPWLTSVIKQNVRPAVTDAEGNELAPEEEFLGIAEGNFIAVLTSALQEAIGEIESLKARVAALESA